MYKLILLSKHFTRPAKEKAEFVLGKKIKDAKFLFCASAAGLVPKAKRDFVENSKDELRKLKIDFQELKLEDYLEKDKHQALLDLLVQYEVVFFTGGSSFYLNYLFHETKLIKHYRRLLEGGLLHIGFSAGAIVCQKDLKYTYYVDQPDNVPRIYEKGLGFFPFYIFPHYTNKEKYTKAVEYLLKDKKFVRSREKFIPLENHQGIFVSGEDWELI